MTAYPFVAAAAQYGVRKGPVKAFVLHMAEGGGTVGFLSRPNPRGVSVHYVIEYSGRIVQMVKESDATGSINPNDLRTTDDPETFGATVRKAVMGEWDRDPNSATITLEIEGFAATGPNDAQRTALKALVTDVRSRYPGMGLLGHRDFQDYKACPGKLIPWVDIGGHGPAQGDDMATTITIERYPARSFSTKTGLTKLRRFTATGEDSAITAPYSGSVDANVTIVQSDGRIPKGSGFLRLASGGSAGYYIIAAQVDVAPAPAPVDCTNAVAAEHERTRAAAIAAVEAIK